MTAEDDHQADLERLEHRLDQLQEDAPVWTQEQLEEAREAIHEARRHHVGMMREDGED